MKNSWAGKTVLIVDDDELITIELTAILTRIGFSICGTAFTAFDGLRMANDLRPDLITMDVHLGASGEGRAAVTLLRMTDLDTPVLFVTGRLDPDAIDGFLGLGRSGYVAKPFNKLAITQALRKLFSALDGSGE